MKKHLILTLVALSVIMSAQAQFRLTDRGFVNIEDKKLDYYIIECPGMNKCDIADAVSYFTEARLANPWTRFNGLNCESFTVNGVAPQSIYQGSRMFRDYYDMEYRIMFDFVDGFVRVWAPEILVMSLRKPSDVSVGLNVGVGNANIGVGHQLPDNITYMYVSENYSTVGAKGYDFSSISIFNRNGKLKQKYAKQSLEEYFNGFIGKLEQYIAIK